MRYFVASVALFACFAHLEAHFSLHIPKHRQKDGYQCRGSWITGRICAWWCGSYKYVPSKQICCGNKVYYKWMAGCCNDCVYSKRVSGCCDDEVYSKKTHICCGNELSEKNSASLSCCGDAPYDTRTSGCCKSKTVYDLETENCCGGNVYNKMTQKCCANEVIYNATTEKCCGSKTYDKLKKGCCDEKLSVVYDLATEKCCGEDKYNESTQYCCNHEPYYMGGTMTTSIVYVYPPCAELLDGWYCHQCSCDRYFTCSSGVLGKDGQCPLRTIFESGTGCIAAHPQAVHHYCTYLGLSISNSCDAVFTTMNLKVVDTAGATWFEYNGEVPEDTLFGALTYISAIHPDFDIEGEERNIIFGDDVGFVIKCVQEDCESDWIALDANSQSNVPLHLARTKISRDGINSVILEMVPPA